MKLNPHWLKITATGVFGLIVLVGAKTLIAPPPLTVVAVVKTSIPAATPVLSTDLQWVSMVKPPSNAITRANFTPHWDAAQTLLAGQSLVQNDLIAPSQATGLKPREVQWMVPLSGALSGLPSLGERMDVWSDTALSLNSNNALPLPIQWARGVRVIGLYNSNGQPVGPNAVAANGSTAPSTQPIAIVGLAVPKSALPVLLGVLNLQLVPDPYATAFQLLATPQSITPVQSKHQKS